MESNRRVIFLEDEKEPAYVCTLSTTGEEAPCLLAYPTSMLHRRIEENRSGDRFLVFCFLWEKISHERSIKQAYCPGS